MKHLRRQFEVKEVSEKGEFAGYASVFGNVDEGGDIVVPGAFKQIEKTKDGKVRVLYQHRQDEPIGKASLREDETGLAFEGVLNLEVPEARKAHSLMKDYILDGMSIGYDVLEGGASRDERGVRTLSRLKLWEISVVTFGMNPEARIERVKGLAEIKTIREFEDFLRDVGGFSQKEARALASDGFKAVQSHRDGGDEQAAGNELAAILRGFSLSTD